MKNKKIAQIGTRKFQVIIILFILIILILILFILSIVIPALPKQKASPFYQSLANQCTDSCCRSSVEVMASNGYSLASGKTLAQAVCPAGFQANELKCPTSYIWCEPSE